jgi:hypothetical protein
MLDMVVDTCSGVPALSMGTQYCEAGGCVADAAIEIEVFAAAAVFTTFVEPAQASSSSGVAIAGVAATLVAAEAVAEVEVEAGVAVVTDFATGAAAIAGAAAEALAEDVAGGAAAGASADAADGPEMTVPLALLPSTEICLLVKLA